MNEGQRVEVAVRRVIGDMREPRDFVYSLVKLGPGGAAEYYWTRAGSCP